MIKNHMTTKRTLAFALSFGLAATALAGCSGSGSDTPASPKSSEAKGVVIKYMHRLPDGEGMTKVEDIAAKWNAAHPNIKVETTKFPGAANEMIKKLETDIKSNNGPCLAQLGYAEVPEMFVKGLVIDVSDEAKKYRSDFGGAFEQMSVGGKYVGLPQDSGPLVYVYNKTEFDKLGIKVPTNVEEFKAAAKKAASAGKYIADFEPDEVQNWLSAQAGAAGDMWYDASGDAWKVNTTAKGSQTVADMWQYLLDNKLVLTDKRWDDSFKADITSRKLIGTIAAAWEPALIAGDLAKTDQKGQWRVAQLIDFGAGAKTGPDGGSGVAVMKGCAHPKEAMEFNAWFNTQIKELATQGLVTAALGKVETPAAQKDFFGGQDIYAEFEKANKNLVGFPYIPGFSTVQSPMGKAADAAVKGAAKVIDIFKAAQTASVKALEDQKLPVAK